MVNKILLYLVFESTLPTNCLLKMAGALWMYTIKTNTNSVMEM